MPEQLITDRRRQNWLLLSVALGAFLIYLDSYIVSISLPVMARDFGVGTSAVSGVVLVYLLVLTSTLLLFGKLGDVVGLKPIYVGGYGLFTVGSLLCGMSSTLTMLLISRCLQGLGGAMLFAVGPTLIPRFLPAGMRGWAFGLVITAGSLGMTLANPIGGFITGTLGWKWVFLVGVPFGALGMLVTWRILPADRGDSKSIAAFDVAGAVLVVGGLVLLVLGMNEGEEWGWRSHRVFASLLAAIVLIVAFALRERKAVRPMLDTRLFRDRDFDLASVTSLFGYAVMAGSNFLMPFYLAGVKGLRPASTGLVLLTFSAVYGALSPIMGRLSDRVSPKRLCIVGMLSAAASCAFFAYTLQFPGLLCTFLYLVWLGVSYATFIPPSNNLIMSIAPAAEIGEASGVYKTMTNLSFVLGVSFYETVFSLRIPGGVITSDTPPVDLILGCRGAMLVGVAICLVTLWANARIRAGGRS